MTIECIGTAISYRALLWLRGLACWCSSLAISLEYVERETNSQVHLEKGRYLPVRLLPPGILWKRK